MHEMILKLLAPIKNPITGKTFTEEARWRDISVDDDGHVRIVYARDGIAPNDKRLIEKTIAEFLSTTVGQEKLTLQSVSQGSEDVYKAAAASVAPAASEKAQLKTGHAVPSPKKSVPGVGKVVAIASGKGGVGKSTFTVNLACSLARMGKKVGIIDADVYGPSIPMLMGKREEKPMASAEKKILPIDAHGVQFMSFGLFVGENEPVIWRGPMLGGVLNQFLFDTNWEGTDYLLIDLPPGTGDMQLSMVQNCHVDGAIIISTPQDVALLDATKGLEMFRKLNLPIIGMVENMSSFVCSKCGEEHFLFGKGGVEKAVQTLEVPFLGQIPLELELRQSADNGRPYMANPEFEGRLVARSYQTIAERVDRFFSGNEESTKGGLFSRLFNR